MVFRRAVLWLLLLAVVAAQALGLMHRVVHGPAGQTVRMVHIVQRVQTAQVPAAHTIDLTDQGVACASHGPHGTGWIMKLFASHADDSTCRLFDPLHPESAPSVPVVVPATVLASLFIDLFQGEFLARRAALYEARGPPPPR